MSDRKTVMTPAGRTIGVPLQARRFSSVTAAHVAFFDVSSRHFLMVVGWLAS
jgi:hypothetical protein